MEPRRMRADGEISREDMAMTATTEQWRTLLEVVQEMASEMMAFGCQRIVMATTAMLVLPDKVPVPIGMDRVDTSTKCRLSTRDETSRAIVVAEARTEEVGEVETPDVAITRTAAVGTEEGGRRGKVG